MIVKTVRVLNRIFSARAKRMKPLERRNSLKSLTLLCGIVISAIFLWFAANQYKMSSVLAEENLRGLALSLSAAVETIAAKEPTFAVLKDFQTNDIAYFALIDQRGTILFHVNSALIGKKLGDRRSAAVFEKGEFSGGRVLLGTGEEVYESNAPIHVRGITLALRLALHTYRVDSIIRKARAGVLIIVSLITVAWGMAFLLARYVNREERHKREMAQRREMARLGEMGAVIAHEIRNPLAGIKGYAQLLQEKQEDEEDRLFTGLIVNEAIRLEEILNGLLAYTQSGSGALSQVPIHEAAARALSVIAPEAAASGVDIECYMDDSLVIGGTPNRLEQLFLNLFSNALQAMPGGGTLKVAGQRAESAIEVLVTDTGHGIAAEDMERIFEPFFTTKIRGTGLGLALCKKILEEHRGSIVAESIPGKGTTFRVTFPVPQDRIMRKERRYGQNLDR